MVRKTLFHSLLSVLAVLLFSGGLYADEASQKEGKKLFLSKCASCHNPNMKSKSTGPALEGIGERWEGRETVLYDWIRNSSAVIASGDAYANALYNEYGQANMTAFPNLKDEEITKILEFIDCKAAGTCIGAPVVTQNETTEGPKKGGSSNTLFYILLGVLGLLALVLARIISNLNYLAKVKTSGGEVPARKTLWETLTNKRFVSLLIFGLVVIGGFTTVNNAINLGRQQGYEPQQPIEFSHEIHAGVNKIECQYCHDGARRSKHAVIPATNTCMNCHKAIQEGPTHGRKELTKIYASAGFNPNSGNYEDFSDLKTDDIRKVFTDWFMNDYEGENKDSILKKNEREIKENVANVMPFVNRPIEWTRVHNLPDHVYFNHAQHVVVGGVECQTCHGPVETMEVVSQHAPLSMGWCVNCHRKTEVKFNDNDYYASYHLYHEDIKNGDRKSVTVEDIGGLECQKCHY